MIGFSIEQIARVTDGVLDQVVDPARIVTHRVGVPMLCLAGWPSLVSGLPNSMSRLA